MRKIASFFLVFVLSMFMLTCAFATTTGTGVAGESNTPNTVTTTTETNTDGKETTNDNYYNVPDPQDAAGIPDVTTDQIVDKINEKGNDVVNIMQAVGKWVCVVVFIVCAILFIVGIIGNKQMAVAALIGLIMSGIAYAGILCGREIVSFIATWAAS